MCRVMSKPVFWITDQVRINLMTWIIYMYMYFVANAISVRTSAMNSSRQPKIRVLKLNGDPCSLLVANAESCEYAVHSSCVNFCSKRSLVPKIYV